MLLSKSADANHEADASMRSPWPVFWIASIAVFLVGLDTTLLFAAFQAIRQSFPGTSPADLSWVLNAYTVVYAGTLIPAGSLSDSLGRKRTFLSGVAIFLIGSAACGLAPSVPWLIAARVAQAIGASLLTPASLSIVLAAFPQNKRALVVSLWGAVGGLAAAVGPSLGSFVIDTAGWPWAFYLNVPLGALSLWQGARRLPNDSPVTSARIDGVGMVLVMVGVGAVVLGIVESGSPDWTRTEVGAAAALGIVASVGFVIWARFANAPLVDLGLFRDRTYSFVNAASLTFGAAFSMMFFGYFVFLTNIWQYSLTRAGLAVTPGPLLVVPVAILTGRYAGRYGHRAPLVAGGVLHACSALWFLLALGPHPSYLTHWLPGMILSGIGVGMVLPSLSAAAVHRLPPGQYAIGSAINQAIRQVGSVLGVAFSVLLIGRIGVIQHDFVGHFAVQSALAMLTAALCLAVRTAPAAEPTAPSRER